MSFSNISSQEVGTGAKLGDLTNGLYQRMDRLLGDGENLGKNVRELHNVSAARTQLGKAQEQLASINNLVKDMRT